MMLEPHEQACIASFRNRETPSQIGTPDELAAWVGFGLGVVLEAGRVIRAIRLAPLHDLVEIKEDGSPTLPWETDIEQLLQERLASFAPDARIVGEETGGVFDGKGLTVAMDPVDGTWALLSRTENLATSLAVFRDRDVVGAMVLNPVTGELGYVTLGGRTRLIQLAMFGEPDQACFLPAERARPESRLVNVHPARKARIVVDALYEAWGNSEISMVRSPGGSPSSALLEAAKGSSVYFNLWEKRPAEVYDLAAGTLLVRGAGGDVTDLEGRPIEASDHTGPLVAGVDATSRNEIAEIVLRVVDADGVPRA